MTFADRSDCALFLAAVAVLGLVVTPLLHVEEHYHEEHEEEADSAAVAEASRAGSTDPQEKLAYALEHAHEPQCPKRADEHECDHQHGHSHGPAGTGPHGSGTLAHLGLALYAAPQLPQVTVVAQDHASPAAVVAQLRGTLRYLVPEWSQGPPIGC